MAPHYSWQDAPEPTSEAGYQPANAVIAFALYQQHGQGTRMSHATIDEHKTLCGHTITEDWMFDGAWGGGPECTRCQDRARALSEEYLQRRMDRSRDWTRLGKLVDGEPQWFDTPDSVAIINFNDIIVINNRAQAARRHPHKGFQFQDLEREWLHAAGLRETADLDATTGALVGQEGVA